MKYADILIFGDICPDNDYRTLFDNSATGAFHETVAEEIKTMPLVITNLECPATGNRIPIPKTGPNLRAEPKDIALLAGLGFDVLSLANNHVLDYGILSVDETLCLCKEVGVKTVGAGSNRVEASKPLICSVSGKRVGILSFAEAEFNLATASSAGANHFDPYSSFDAVRALKANTDYVIVLYHGGIEYYKLPSPLLQKKCRKFTEAGADLVLCQHSHCIGTMEEYAGGTILYGQGNAVFGYREGNQAWNEGLAVSVDLETGQIGMRLLHARPEGVCFAPEKEEAERLRQLRKDSEVLSNSEIISSEWSKFCHSQAALDLPLLYGKGRIYNKLNRLLGNRLIRWCYSRKKQRITMNMIRCEAHHEVVRTILEDTIFQ